MSQTLTTPDAPVDGHSARRLQTRARLLQAGTELFAEQGVQAVTTTAIASAAGVATGTFYLHFDDKHALFEELVQEALEEMRSHIDLNRLDDLDDKARRAGLEHMMQVAERRRDLIRAVFDQSGTSDLVERIQDRIASRLEPVYARLFADDGVALDAGGAAQARAAVLVRLVAWWADSPSTERRRQVVDLLFEMDPLRFTRLGSTLADPEANRPNSNPQPMEEPRR